MLHLYISVQMFSGAGGRAPGETSSSFNEPDLGLGGVIEAFTPEMREKVVKLEKENQILRRRLDSANAAESAPAGGDLFELIPPL